MFIYVVYAHHLFPIEYNESHFFFKHFDSPLSSQVLAWFLIKWRKNMKDQEVLKEKI